MWRLPRAVFVGWLTPDGYLIETSLVLLSATLNRTVLRGAVSGRLHGMAQTPGDDNKDEPSLELPSLSLPGFGRRNKRRKHSPDVVAQDEPSEAAAERPEEPLATPQPGEESGPGAAAATRATPASSRTEDAAEVAPHATGQTTLHEESQPPPVVATGGRRTAKRSGPILPAVPGRVAAAITGLVVGMAGSLATYGAMAGCEVVRGVSSCGGAPGFFILVAILTLMVLLGALALRALQVSDPGSTSFLAVGVVTVVAMLVLIDVIFSPWMFLVVPVLTALSFVLSHWVTTRFEDEPGRRDWA